MEERQDDALLERASSSETMTEPRRRNPNGKALKLTGLTVLACLLLAGQAFTAYYVVKQKGHLQALEMGQDSLKKVMTTHMLKGAPKMMQSPLSKMPLMVAMDEKSPRHHIPLTKLESASFQMPKEGSGLVDGPIGVQTRFRASRPLLTDFSVDNMEEEGKTPEHPATVVETKCKLEAGQVKPGFFQPQCDEQGNFKPKQCWHSTGFCWCVDKDGKEIPGTLTRGALECGNVN